jgi:uncharacterized protein
MAGIPGLQARARLAAVVSDSDLLQFPTDYPIKVVGRPSDDLRARVHAIFIAHAPDLDTSRISERISENGNFVSISYVIQAVSREQIVALVTALQACDEVVMVL